MSDYQDQGDRYDVAIVGGGPAGCSAGVFAARYGLDTVIFDRGRSSLRQCAFLENYLGFPAGIDVETMYDLIHDHAAEAGCELVDDLVTSVRRGESGFRIEPETTRPVSARWIVAATKYGAPYLRSLDEESLFVDSADGSDRVLDRDRLGSDGRTPIDGLYVAGPLAGVGDQAIVAAGHGAAVARNLVTDRRRDEGYWKELAEHYDWVRRDAELSDEWRDRERWYEWIDDHDISDDLSNEEFARLREEYVDARFERYVTDAEIEARSRRGHRRLAEHLDDEILLKAIDDERLREYARTTLDDSGGGDERV